MVSLVGGVGAALLGLDGSQELRVCQFGQEIESVLGSLGTLLSLQLHPFVPAWF